MLEEDLKVFTLSPFHGRGQAEKEFRVEVEAIGHVRHKNLVRLLGYCIEGTHRYLSSLRLLYVACLWSKTLFFISHRFYCLIQDVGI